MVVRLSDRTTVSAAAAGTVVCLRRARLHGAKRRRPHDGEVVVGLTTACTALALYALFLLATGI